MELKVNFLTDVTYIGRIPGFFSVSTLMNETVSLKPES